MKKIITLLIAISTLQLNGQSQTVTELTRILAAQSVNKTGIITTQNLAPTSGVATANSSVELSLGNHSMASIQVSGIYTGVLSVQTTVDGLNWLTVTNAVAVKNITNGVFSANIPSASQAQYSLSVDGISKVRVTALAAVTGTATVTIKAVQGSPFITVSNALPAGTASIGAVTQGGTWTVQPGNTANTTAWLTELRTGTTNGSTTFFLNSAATTNATLVKSSAGMLYYVMATNTSASTKFVRFYNLTTSPTVGTSTPILVYSIPANSSVSLPLPSMGLKFSTGISFAITGAAAYLDASAVAAGDVVLTYNFQ
jgi:PBP1b-binding outer membrane lipoprotein LpoB